MVDPIPNIHPSLEVSLSNETILLVSLLGFTFLFAALACLCHFSPSQAQHDEKEGTDGDDDVDAYDKLLEDADVSTLNRAQRKARAKWLMKKKRRLANPNNANIGADGADGNGDANANNEGDEAIVALDAGEDIDDVGDNSNNNNGRPKLSRKERQKAAKEEERLYRREYEEIRKLKIKDEIQRRETKDKLQIEKKEQLEREKQESLEKEFRLWKYMFGGGVTVTVTVNEFLKELKENQIINIKDTATRFEVSEEELICRLRQLEKEGRIDHGIIDKENRIYFFVMKEDMVKVSEFIKEKEVVTLDEITMEVSRIINDKRMKL
jgi:hypothetical protein